MSTATKTRPKKVAKPARAKPATSTTGKAHVGRPKKAGSIKEVGKQFIVWLMPNHGAMVTALMKKNGFDTWSQLARHLLEKASK